jgi:membrane-bound lytic murein transglycosylase D
LYRNSPLPTILRRFAGILLLLALASCPITAWSAERPAGDAETAPLTITTTSVSQPGSDPRLDRATARFNEGKRLLSDGKKPEARKEFDGALDLLLSASADTPDRVRLEKKIEELTDKIYRIDVETLEAGELDKPVFEKAPLDEIREMSYPVDPGLRPKASDEVKLTRSDLPLVLNDSVLSFINYFNSDRGKRTLIAGMKRAGRYSGMISRILREEGVPQELIFLAQAESGFAARAVSYMAAAGMWQFVQFRGQEYGLKQSAWHDDRLDPEKATRAAARHLRDLYQQFGDWHLALAAYNCGPMCVSSAVQRTGYADYWELRSRHALPRETSNYVPIILAMTIMTKNPKDYGIEDVAPDSPLEYDSVRMDSNTGLQLLADISDTPLTVLKELNPSLTQNVVPAGEAAKIPKGSKDDVESLLGKIPNDKRMLWRVHRVQSGETLESVVRSYRTSAQQVQATNELTSRDVDPGELLVVPVAPEPPKPVYRYVWVRGRRVLVAWGAKPVQPVRSAVSYTAKAPAKVVSPVRGKITQSSAAAALRVAPVRSLQVKGRR